MRSNDRWLLRDVTIDGRRRDCRLRNGQVAEIAEDLPAAGPDEQLLQAEGGTLLAGLSDHHIHVLALAAALASVDLAGSDDIAGAPEPPGGGWGRVIGAGRALTRGDLDRRWPQRPVRVQHRGGRLWTLNSAGVAELRGALSEQEAATGQLWNADRRLRELLGPADRPDVSTVGRMLAGYGITHLSDASPELDLDTIIQLRADLPQHVMSMAADGDGPRKIVLSDSTRPDFDGFCETIAAAHEAGRGVAIHTVSAWTLALALAGLNEVGTVGADRLEHVAVCDDDGAERIAELGLAVVTQPTIFARHGERFLVESPVEERPWLWRLGGLVARGVRLAVSSDAPYGDPDPARTLRASTSRPVEGIPIAVALATMLTSPADPTGPVRTVEVGAAADLCLLSQGLEDALAAVNADASWPVAATFVNGQIIHRNKSFSSIR